MRGPARPSCARGKISPPHARRDPVVWLALKRGYMAVNPLDALELPQVLCKPPAIFTIK